VVSKSQDKVPLSARQKQRGKCQHVTRRGDRGRGKAGGRIFWFIGGELGLFVLQPVREKNCSRRIWWGNQEGTGEAAGKTTLPGVSKESKTVWRGQGLGGRKFESPGEGKKNGKEKK